jgi:hypothetical protein
MLIKTLAFAAFLGLVGVPSPVQRPQLLPTQFADYNIGS